jgi:hypothetical protein
MGGSNQKGFEGMEYIQRVYFGYECLEDGDPYTKIMIYELKSSFQVISFSVPRF